MLLSHTVGFTPRSSTGELSKGIFRLGSDTIFVQRITPDDETKTRIGSNDKPPYRVRNNSDGAFFTRIKLMSVDVHEPPARCVFYPYPAGFSLVTFTSEPILYLISSTLTFTLQFVCMHRSWPKLADVVVVVVVVNDIVTEQHNRQCWLFRYGRKQFDVKYRLKITCNKPSVWLLHWMASLFSSWTDQNNIVSVNARWQSFSAWPCDSLVDCCESGRRTLIISVSILFVFQFNQLIELSATKLCVPVF